MTEGSRGAGFGDGMAIPFRDCLLTEWGEEEVVTRRPAWAHARKERAACEGVSSGHWRSRGREAIKSI